MVIKNNRCQECNREVKASRGLKGGAGLYNHKGRQLCRVCYKKKEKNIGNIPSYKGHRYVSRIIKDNWNNEHEEIFNKFFNKEDKRKREIEKVIYNEKLKIYREQYLSKLKDNKDIRIYLNYRDYKLIKDMSTLLGISMSALCRAIITKELRKLKRRIKAKGG